MKTIYIIAVVALMSSSAQAWEERTTCAHSRFYGTSSCRTIGIEDQRQARDPAEDAEAGGHQEMGSLLPTDPHT